MKPGERIVRGPRERRTYAGPSLGQAQLICVSCGTANKADQNFCRRCTNSLAPQQVAATARGPNGRALKDLPAGTRPKWKTRHFPTRLVAGLAAVLLLGGGLYAGRDSVVGSVQRIRDEFFDGELKPTRMAASAFLRDQRPDLAKDGFVDTGWAATLPTGKERPYIEADFGKPVRLVYVFITTRAEKTSPAQKVELLPTKIGIFVRHGSADSKSRYQKVEPFPRDLTSSAKRHGLYVGVSNVQAVRITIEETQPPPGKPKSAVENSVTIAELQFSNSD